MAGNAEPSIDSVDAFARQLYRRARTAGSNFDDLADMVRSLGTMLRHLRAEADDRDSVLNGKNQDSTYARQLPPMIADCDFTLRQLDMLLGKYADKQDGGSPKIGSREHDMLALIQKKLADQKTNIEMFLDTVQLHSPTKNSHVLDNADGAQLDAIKDKLDSVASRLYRRNSLDRGDVREQDLWPAFSAELEKEGFSSDVLHRNKEVLRAYVRQLDSHQLAHDGTTPSVRGMLKDPSARRTDMVPGASAANHGGSGPSHRRQDSGESGATTDELAPAFDPNVPRSLQPYHQTLGNYAQDSAVGIDSSQTASNASENECHANTDMSFVVSTGDLMSYDDRDAETLMQRRMASMHVTSVPTPPNHYSCSPDTSSNSRPAAASPQPLQMTNVINSSQNLYGSSPRYVPPLPPYPTSSSPVAANSPSAYSLPPAPYGTAGPSRLGPDARGQPIPLDAKWTQITRRLVSPEVLAKAGVRYEARPDFVFILGLLSKEQITQYARQSAEAREARTWHRPVDPRQYPARQPDDRLQSTRSDPRGDPDEGKRVKVRHDGSTESDSDASSESSSDSSFDDVRERTRRFNRSRYVPKDYVAKECAGDRDREQTSERTRERTRERDARRESDDNNDDKDDKSKDQSGSRVLPVVVPAPSDDKASPASTVSPKPILKNRNPNRVRFDETGPREVAPSEPEESRNRGSKRSSHRDRSRDRERRRRGGSRDRGDRGDRGDKEKGDRERRRHHHRDREDREHHHRDREDRDRDRGDRDRDRDRDRDKRRSHVKEATNGAGIGGVAATLLSVLTEAASHGF